MITKALLLLFFYIFVIYDELPQTGYAVYNVFMTGVRNTGIFVRIQNFYNKFILKSCIDSEKYFIVNTLLCITIQTLSMPKHSNNPT